MTAAMLVQILIQFGPGAIELIQKLITLWSKPALSLQEITDICNLAQKSYDDYIKQAGGPKSPMA